MYRPDYTEPDMDAREFIWSPTYQCFGESYHNFVNDNPFFLFNRTFAKRVPATFHGIDCYLYYDMDTSDMICAYGDHTKDVVYGVDIKMHTHVPDDMKFTSADQPNCDEEACTTPDKDMWKNAYSVVPK